MARKPKVMRSRPVVSALLDMAAGLIAITAVLGSCFASHRIGLDFRAIFALTAVAFFLAGIARGSPNLGFSPWQIVRISAPGLLGTVGLILNNGFHRLAMPVGLVIIAVFMVAAGISVRRSFRANCQRSSAIACGALALAALASLLVVPRLSAYSAFDAQLRPTPPFVLSVDGRTVSSAGLHGRVVALAFWASWCAPCIQELPHLQRIFEHFRNDPRVVIYAVDLGWYGETPEKGRQFLARHRLDLPMACDAGTAAKGFGIDSIPAVVLMDANGRARFTHNGYDTSENIEEGLTRHIDELLASR
jgi:thiol-disulfide isomerase/thioredoxin